MGKGYRQGRLGEEIRRIVSEMLINGIKDPRLAGKMLSVSGVSVTPRFRKYCSRKTRELALRSSRIRGKAAISCRE